MLYHMSVMIIDCGINNDQIIKLDADGEKHDALVVALHYNKSNSTSSINRENCACFVHKLGSLEDGDEDNNDVEYAKQLHANMIRTQTQMRYIQMREHLIANDFTPTWQCPLSAKFPLLINADGAIVTNDELQHFLNAHLNSQRYVRLLSVELPSPSDQYAAWRVQKSENNIMQIMPPQISVPNEEENVQQQQQLRLGFKKFLKCLNSFLFNEPNLQPNVCNHVYIMSPKSIIAKYEERSNLIELIEFIYQQSSLDCAVQIQLPSAYLEKKSNVDVSRNFLHVFLQQLLQDYLLPKHPCSPRAPYICEFLIHPDFDFDIWYPVVNLNLGEFTSQHQFRRINYGADDEHFISMEDISPAIQRLNVDDEYSEDDPYDLADSQLGFAFYDSNTKDHWRLHWTQLSADLCQMKICQFNEERDTAFHMEYNKELTTTIDNLKNGISLENSFFSVKRHYFDQIGPFMGPQNVLHHIDEPLKMKEMVGRHSAGRPIPLRLAPISNGKNGIFRNGNGNPLGRSLPDLRQIFNRHGNDELSINRWFVAIQYNQPSQGKPPDKFTLGTRQLAKVYDRNEDGYCYEDDYFWAEIRGLYGLIIPAGKLAKIVKGDLFLTAQLQDEGGGHELQEQQQDYWPANSASGWRTGPIGRWRSCELGKKTGQMSLQQQGQDARLKGAPRQLMVARYDYDPRRQSPNVDGEQVEMSFRKGDLIIVYGPMDQNGFYLGEFLGLRRLVPANFLQPADTAS